MNNTWMQTISFVSTDMIKVHKQDNKPIQNIAPIMHALGTSFLCSYTMEFEQHGNVITIFFSVIVRKVIFITY